MLTKDQRNAIEAAIPAGVDIPQAFWRDLEAAISYFRVMEKNRAGVRQRREPYQHADKLAEALAVELRAIRLTIPADSVDPLWPNRALRALWEIKQHTEAALEGYAVMGANPDRSGKLRRGGRGKLQREVFYRAICDLWIDLGQRLRASTSPAGKPTGPFIRFFRACARPVIGDVAAETVASIIDRERTRRERKR